MTRELLQEKLHKMQKNHAYRFFTFEKDKGVSSMPELSGLSSYLILTGAEWFAKNGDQQLTSDQRIQDRILFAETREKLFLPKEDKTALYASPNYPAMSCLAFAYVLICDKMIFAGFLGGNTSGKYYTIQLPNTENGCLCMMDLVMSAVANTFPDDLEKLRAFFKLGSYYDAGDETIFEE